MKKIFIALVCLIFSVSAFGQKETDVFNWVLFKEINKLPIQNSYSVPVIKKTLLEIRSETKDSLLIFSINKRIDELDSLKFYKEIKVDDSKLSKEHLKKIRTDVDKFTGLKQYYSLMAGSRFQPVIIIKDSIMSLRLTTQLNNNRWVFKETAQVLVDNQTYSFKLENINREVLSGSQVLETSNTSLNETIFNMFEDIYNGCENVSIRYYGDRIYDFSLVKNEIEKIKKLMDVFYILEHSLD